MRCTLVVALLLFGGVSREFAAAQDDPREVGAIGLVDLRYGEWGDPETPRAPTFEPGELPNADDALYESDDPQWQAVVRSLRSARVRLSVTAFRVIESGGAASGVLASDDVFLNADAQRDVRAAIAAGALLPLGRVATTGRFEDTLRGTDGQSFRAPVEYDSESAIKAALSFPISPEIRSGLTVAARAAPHVGGAYALAFHARAVGNVATDDVLSVAGRRTVVAAPVFVARGALVLRDTDVACVRGIDASGAGFLLLIRMRGNGVAARRAPLLPIALGDDHVALPTAVLCHAQTATPVSGAFVAWSKESPDRARVVPWTEDVAVDPPLIDDVLRAEGLAYEDSVHRMRGLALVRTQPGAAHATARQMRAILEARSTCVLRVQTPDHGRIVVSFLDGGAPSAFLGTVGTHVEGLEVETGCHSCITAADTIGHTWTGMVVAASGAPGQPARIDVATRARVSASRRVVPVRRLLPGLASFVHDDLAFDFVADAQSRVRSLLPPGGATIARDIAVALLGRAPVDVVPTRIAVNGAALYVAPDQGARLREVRSVPAIVSWGWDASCGMSLRYPEVTGIVSGIDVAIRPGERGDALQIVADLRGKPESLETSFDMGDGIVDVLRVPQLSVETAIPSGAIRRVAWGSGLELRVGVTSDADRPPLRTATVATDDGLAGGGTAGVRFIDGARVVMEVGGRTLLPIEVDEYESNHLSGEGATATRPIRDGVRFVLDRARDRVARGWATLRGSASRRAFSLRKFQAPRRPDTGVHLLLPTRSMRTVPLTVAHGRTLELLLGISRPVRISVAKPAVEEDE